MKILREVKCSERLPEKEEWYFTISNLNNHSHCIFTKDKEWITDNGVDSTNIVKYWYEPITIELKSEEILPLSERFSKIRMEDMPENSLYYKYHKALEAAELEIVNLKHLE